MGGGAAGFLKMHQYVLVCTVSMFPDSLQCCSAALPGKGAKEPAAGLRAALAHV